MSEQVIDFNTDGSVEALYSDEIDLSHLGKQTMNRASHVLFNDKSQLWDVEPVGYNPHYLPIQYSGFATYKQAVAFEVAIFNKAREMGLLDKLQTKEGAKLANSVYTKLYNEGSEGF